MKFAVVCPDSFREYYYDVYVDLFQQNFPEVEVDYLLYSRFEESLPLLQGKQSKYDAILFAGKGCYIYLRRVLQQETAWICMERNQCDIYRAVLEVKARGYDPLRLSFDCFTHSDVIDVYREMGYRTEDMQISVFGEVERHGEEGYDERMFQFHKKCYAERRCSLCCTRTSTVAKMLKAAGIPFVYAFPIRSTIRDQISFARRLVASHSYQRPPEQMVAIIRIREFPAFVSPEDYYDEAALRRRIAEKIGDYAKSIHGLVLCEDQLTFVLFANKENFLLQTNDLKDFSRLRLLLSVGGSMVHVGIGFGITNLDAYSSARRGVQMQSNTQTNGVIIHYDSNSFLQIDSEGCTEGETKYNNLDRLQQVASDTTLSLETVMKLYYAAKKTVNGEFTVEQVAEILGISKRSASRIIEKLLDKHYAVMLSKLMVKKKGRPAYCYQITFDGV